MQVTPDYCDFQGSSRQRRGAASDGTTENDVLVLSSESIQLIVPGQCRRRNPIADRNRTSPEEQKHTVRKAVL